MKTRRFSPLRWLAFRYRELEHAGHSEGLLVVVSTAGGLTVAGVALLAFVQTHAALILALGLMLLATIAVLVTVLVMVGDEEASPRAVSRERGGARRSG
jgi:hypothetical protein